MIPVCLDARPNALRMPGCLDDRLDTLMPGCLDDRLDTLMPGCLDDLPESLMISPRHG